MQPSTITYLNPNSGFTATITLPAEIVAMLQTIQGATYLPQYPAPAPAGTSEAGKPPVLKYENEADVITQDVIEVLVPRWAQQLHEAAAAPLLAQIETDKKALQKKITAALSAVTKHAS